MGRKDNKEPKTISVPDVTNVTNVTIILRCVPKLEDLTVSTLYLASYAYTIHMQGSILAEQMKIHHVTREHHLLLIK